MVSTRLEIEAAQHEYDSFLVQSGLSEEFLQHVPMDEVPLAQEFADGQFSGILIGGSPQASMASSENKTRTQLRIEDGVREILAVGLQKGVPVLATGFASEVLVEYLGGTLSSEFAEPMGATTIFLTDAAQDDPVLADLPRAFEAFAGHRVGAVEVPEIATLLATSADCPVQILRAGETVYGVQFSPECDPQRFTQRMSVYEDAGYGDVGQVAEVVLASARPTEQHLTGQIIRNFVAHFSLD